MFRHVICALMAWFCLAFAPAQAKDSTIKIGILHSLTGGMAVSEANLKDTLLMLIAEQNQKGGLLGHRLEAVVMDPGSNWPRFAQMSREMLTKDNVVAIFGCWTSGARQAVLPVVEELNGLLFYPAPFEGEESSRNVIYTGSSPNQQALPAVDYLIYREGIRHWLLLGADYSFPRVTNEIISSYLKSKGYRDEDIQTIYVPFGFSGWDPIIKKIKEFGQGGDAAVISTLSGEAELPFCDGLSKQGVSASEIPVMSFSLSEEELMDVYTAPLVGHLATRNYFESIQSPENQEFIKSWKAFTKNDYAVTTSAMEATYIAFKLWVKAVETAGTTDVEDLLNIIVGLEVPNLSGGMARVLPNHLVTKPVYVGAVREDGQFDILWRSKSEIEGKAYSDYLPQSLHSDANWTPQINCPLYDSRARRCYQNRVEMR
ncbi:MAG: ABC transporter substrate-binding protein [Succinivibrio sp.]|nr:ABC transporter substrate-binding protein [Succinivibrio sp.]